MKAKIALIILLSVSMSGCATVDLVNTGSQTASVSSTETAKVNVVKRAAGKLYSAFTAEGWVENKSKKRVQSTASVLLRGLDTSSSEGPFSDYASSSLTVKKIRADILAAQDYVSQTTKAAEVYLAMASDDTNLREELSSLQQALIVAREAELVFKAALDKTSSSNDYVWKDYSTSVDELRDVTDAFGDRVRSGRTLTSAFQAKIN